MSIANYRCVRTALPWTNTDSSGFNRNGSIVSHNFPIPGQGLAIGPLVREVDPSAPKSGGDHSRTSDLYSLRSPPLPRSVLCGVARPQTSKPDPFWLSLQVVLVTNSKDQYGVFPLFRWDHVPDLILLKSTCLLLLTVAWIKPMGYGCFVQSIFYLRLRTIGKVHQGHMARCVSNSGF